MCIKTEQEIRIANNLYHNSGLSVAEIASRLNCSWTKANRLIIYCQDKWEERQKLNGVTDDRFALAC